MDARRWISLTVCLVLGGLWLVPGEAQARGGWGDIPFDYCYEANAGEDAHVGSKGTVGCLDGFWQRGLNSDEWEGTGPVPGDGEPGGAMVETLPGEGEDGGDASVLTLEDVKTAGGADDNRKIYLLRGTSAPDAGLATPINLANGVTFVARWRVNPAPHSSEYQNNGGAIPVPDGTYLHHDNKAQIAFVQRNAVGGGTATASLGFAITDEGHLQFAQAYGETACQQPPDYPNEWCIDVDETDWVTVWMTAEEDAANPALVNAKVYLNGEAEPAIELTAATIENDSDTNAVDSYINIGLGSTTQTGAIQVDYICVASGVIEPEVTQTRRDVASSETLPGCAPLTVTLSRELEDGDDPNAIVTLIETLVGDFDSSVVTAEQGGVVGDEPNGDVTIAWVSVSLQQLADGLTYAINSNGSVAFQGNVVGIEDPEIGGAETFETDCQAQVANVTCTTTPAGEVLVGWDNNPDADPSAPISIRVNGTEVMTVPGDGPPGALISPFDLPGEGLVEICVVNWSQIPVCCQAYSGGPLFINCGGPGLPADAVVPDGRVWEEDTLENPSPFLVSPNANTKDWGFGFLPPPPLRVVDTQLVETKFTDNPSRSALFATERWDEADITYQFAVPTGDYLVTLLFAEACCSEGCEDIADPQQSNPDGGPCRVVDVVLNGTVVDDQFSQHVEVHRQTGEALPNNTWGIALTREYLLEAVSQIEITIAHLGAESATIKGIAIEPAGPPPDFRRGDANGDGCVTEQDGEFIIQHFTADGPAPLCLEAADADNSGEFNAEDGAFILSFLAGGPTPPTPGPYQCGQDIEDEGEIYLGCRLYSQDLCEIPCEGDVDGDGIGDEQDNCPNTSNPGQANDDDDELGNACDPDDDNDGVDDGVDNCPLLANDDQTDTDGDDLGDACDPDDDGDEVLDEQDNCPLIQNTAQADGDEDGVGNACDNCMDVSNQDQADPDDDGLGSACDNCPDVSNLSQDNTDGDDLGDACDPDDDEDGVDDGVDNCPLIANDDQTNTDDDDLGDACDPDDDNDDVLDEGDNCPLVENNDQANNDEDSFGDVCDNCPAVTNEDQADSDGDGRGDACPLGPIFLRGDVNGDGEVPGTTTDLIFYANHCFLGQAAPPCLAAADVNGDGEVCGTVTDLVFLSSFLFLGQAPPPSPFPLCDVSTEQEDLDLGCVEHPCMD